MSTKSRQYHFSKSELLGIDLDEDLWTVSAKARRYGGLESASSSDGVVMSCLVLRIVLKPLVGSGTSVRDTVKTERSGMGIDQNESCCRYSAGALKGIP